MKSILLRTCLNVTTDDAGNMVDETRYLESLPCITSLTQNYDRVLITAHLGRPKNKEAKYSFHKLSGRLSQDIGKKVTFLSTIEALQSSYHTTGIFFLENVRFFEGEENKNEQDRIEFAKLLSQGCDRFINDAFADYRPSASTFEVAKLLPSTLGPVFQKEIIALNHIKNNPEHPFVVVLGGSKLSEKIDLMQSLLQKADYILIGGAMAYTLLKAKGCTIGNSLYEADKIDVATVMLEQFPEKIILPQDHKYITSFKNPEESGETLNITDDAHIPDNMIAVDIGPKTCELFSSYIMQAKTLLRNGPMGVYEREATQSGTNSVGTNIAKNNIAYSLVGGGDSITAINTLGLTDFSHICTGGGAMLSYLGDDNFPTLDIIQDQKQ